MHNLTPPKAAPQARRGNQTVPQEGSAGQPEWIAARDVHSGVAYIARMGRAQEMEPPNDGSRLGARLRLWHGHRA